MRCTRCAPRDDMRSMWEEDEEGTDFLHSFVPFLASRSGSLARVARVLRARDSGDRERL